MIDYSGYSDADLDAAYGRARELTKSAATRSQGAADMTAISNEIERRLASPFAFISGLVGSERFPIYAGVTSFSQTSAARSSVAVAAQNVSTAIGDTIGNIVGPSVPFLAVTALVLGLVFYAVKRK